MQILQDLEVGPVGEVARVEFGIIVRIGRGDMDVAARKRMRDEAPDEGEIILLAGRRCTTVTGGAPGLYGLFVGVKEICTVRSSWARKPGRRFAELL